MLTCGSYTPGRLFDLIFSNFWFNGILYFSLKNLFCGKSFEIIFSSFYIESFTGNFFFKIIRFPVRIYSLACYLCAGESFSTIFKNKHTFENL